MIFQETAFLSMLIMVLAAMKKAFKQQKQRLFPGNALPRERGLFVRDERHFQSVNFCFLGSTIRRGLRAENRQEI